MPECGQSRAQPVDLALRDLDGAPVQRPRRPGSVIARTLEGRDVLLNVRDHATRRELNRRIRGELRHLGIVDGGRSAPLKDGQRASAGDLVFCGSGGNDAKQTVGEGLTLANGQFFRVESVTGGGRLALRLALHADPETGGPAYSDHVFTYDGREVFDLGYAVTTHAAQSRTVWSGMEVVTGGEDKQGSLVGLTRGTTENLAFVVTPSPRVADPRPGSRPAPEIERARRLESRHAGRTALTGDGRLSVTQSDERLNGRTSVQERLQRGDVPVLPRGSRTSRYVFPRSVVCRSRSVPGQDAVVDPRGRVPESGTDNPAPGG